MRLVSAARDLVLRYSASEEERARPEDSQVPEGEEGDVKAFLTIHQ